MAVTNKTIRIILADDHEVFRIGLQSILKDQSGIELVAEAADGEQLIRLTGQYLPDIVLTDIQMPLMDGLQATAIISQKYPHIGIIALTMFGNDNSILKMMEAGALGYLLKNANISEIIEAIHTVAMLRPYYCSSTTGKMARQIATGQMQDQAAAAKFNERELEVICLICREFSNREISEQLSLSVRTIEGYRERILEKTNARNTAGIVVYAIKNHIYTTPGHDSSFMILKT